MRALRFLPILLVLLTPISCKDRSNRSGELGTFNIGERIQVGPLIYTVLDTQWLVSLGEGPDQRIPANRFMVVNMTIVNSAGKEELSIPSLNMVDDSGKNYPELENGQGVPQWLGFIRKIRPAETATGSVVFDIPPKHFKLKVIDENEVHSAFVDVPLNFGTPPVRVEDAPPAPRLTTPK